MRTRSFFIVVAAALVLAAGFGFHALAQSHMGQQSHMGRGYGSGTGGYGQHWQGLNVDDETRSKLSTERNAFYNETRSLRADIRAKRLELSAELAKNEPNADRAAQLQEELSDLTAEFDRKRLQHKLKMRKIAPEMGEYMFDCPRGYKNCPYAGKGYGGRGFHHGQGMGQGYGGRHMW